MVRSQHKLTRNIPPIPPTPTPTPTPHTPPPHPTPTPTPTPTPSTRVGGQWVTDRICLHYKYCDCTIWKERLLDYFIVFLQYFCRVISVYEILSRFWRDQSLHCAWGQDSWPAKALNGWLVVAAMSARVTIQNQTLHNYWQQATVLDARASRVKWPAQVMSNWYGILFTE